MTLSLYLFQFISSDKVILSWLEFAYYECVLMADQDIQNFVIHSVLSFIGSTEVRYAMLILYLRYPY